MYVCFVLFILKCIFAILIIEICYVKINFDTYNTSIIRLTKIGNDLFINGSRTYLYRKIFKQIGAKYDKTKKGWILPYVVLENIKEILDLHNEEYM